MCQVINLQQTGTRHGQNSRSKGSKNPSPNFQISMWVGILGVQNSLFPRRLILLREQRDQTSSSGIVPLSLWGVQLLLSHFFYCTPFLHRSSDLFQSNVTVEMKFYFTENVNPFRLKLMASPFSSLVLLLHSLETIFFLWFVIGFSWPIKWGMNMDQNDHFMCLLEPSFCQGKFLKSEWEDKCWTSKWQLVNWV